MPRAAAALGEVWGGGYTWDLPMAGNLAVLWSCFQHTSPCREINASGVCPTAALTSICRQGLAALAFVTLALFIGCLRETPASFMPSFTSACALPDVRCLQSPCCGCSTSPFSVCCPVPPVLRGVPAVHHLLINAFWHLLYL